MIMTNQNVLSKRLTVFFLVVICAASFMLALPTIANNVDDPNMIVYFNADEGGLMDIIWSYYSGEIRPSFQWSIEYGLEMLFVSDFARIVLSRFVEITPGILVLTLRWIHLLAWIGALVALWYFVGAHFSRGWQQTVAVLLLAARPAFNYFSNSLKPEPLVLLFMIGGFHFIMRILERPCKKYVLLSILCAAVAFYIKFVGVFLLPVIIAAIYISKHAVFPKIRNSWIFESLLGLFFIALPCLYILFRVRVSTGKTFYEEFGLLQSICNSGIAIICIFAGAILILISAGFILFEKYGAPTIKKIVGKINDINSYAFIVSGIFFGYLLIFGTRWIFKPDFFLNTYSFNLFDFIGVFNMKTGLASGFISSYLKLVLEKVNAFDVFMISLFIVYLLCEVHYRRYAVGEKKLAADKRYMLIVFLLPGFVSLFTMGRFQQHHMLPFFVALSILGIQGIYLFNESFKGPRVLKRAVLIMLFAVTIADISINATELVKARFSQFHQREDVAYEVREWLRENISPDSKIVADHHSRVYIPYGYENVRVLRWGGRGRAWEVRRMVDEYNPQFVYYSEKPGDIKPMPSIQELLPDRKAHLIKRFDNAGFGHQRYPKNRIFVYKIIY